MMIDRRTPLDELPSLMTPDEVRRYLGLSRTTEYALISAGRLRCVQIGRRKWIPREELASPPETAR